MERLINIGQNILFEPPPGNFTQRLASLFIVNDSGRVFTVDYDTRIVDYRVLFRGVRTKRDTVAINFAIP